MQLRMPASPTWRTRYPARWCRSARQADRPEEVPGNGGCARAIDRCWATPVATGRRTPWQANEETPVPVYRLPFDDDGKWKFPPKGNWDDPATSAHQPYAFDF